MNRARWYFRLGLIVAAVFGARGAAVGQEGKLAWSHPFSVQGRVSSSAAASPDGQTIYVGVETSRGTGYVVAINVADPDTPKWRTTPELPDGVHTSSPAVSRDGSTIYVGCDDGRLYAFNAATGARLLHFVQTGAAVASSPAIAADGTVYFGSDDGKLYAATPSLDRVIWTFRTDDAIDSSPAIGGDGTIYFGSWDKNVYAVTPTGALKWKFATDGAVTASPAIGADGTIYIGSHDQRLYALAPEGRDEDRKKWSYMTNDEIHSSAAIGADGTIYFASFDTNFYALNPESDNPRVKWMEPLRAYTSSSPAIRGDGAIIVSIDGGKVIAFDPIEHQTPKWVYATGTTGALAYASPLVAPDGSIYIGFHDGFVYKITGNGSPLSRYSPWPAFRHDVDHTGRALPTGPGQLLNISMRAQVGASPSALIAGLTILGAGQKTYLLRGVGPTLAQFGVGNVMTDPRLTMFSNNVELDFKNDNWGEVLNPILSLSAADAAAAVGAFALPVGSKDAAMVAPLNPGQYTAHVTNVDGTGGVALLEVYDAVGGDSSGRIVNLSSRGPVGTGGNVLIPGFVVGGTGTVRLLIRAVGPGLRQFHVSDVLAQPVLTVFSNSQEKLGSNTRWMSDGFTYDLVLASKRAGAFALEDNSADCALILNATAGAYTIQVSGVGGTTGEALVEIYVLP